MRKQPAYELFTIGYEGKTLDEYLEQLQKAGVKLLCDVRRNPLSRKRGFSKDALREALELQGIKYRHFPTLGIPSAERRELETPDDYRKLFTGYKKRIAREEESLLQELLELLEKHRRVALTCSRSSFGCSGSGKVKS
jgi:uncharacterized protein (DUF488 family)